MLTVDQNMKNLRQFESIAIIEKTPEDICQIETTR